MATIFPKGDFDPEAAATALKDAMDGLGTNEAAIIKVMASHSCEQRLEIADYYKTAYGADLMDDLKSEIGGDFEQTVVAMLASPRVYDARELHRAIAGGGTDEECLIEILVSRSNEEIAEIKEKYAEEFEGANLEEDLQGDTGGYFQRLLVSMCNGTREDDHDEDDATADEDAQKIFDAGEGQLGTDESEFNKVFCLRGRRQLYAMMRKYQEITGGKSMEDVIDSETTGPIHDGYMAIVKHCRYPAAYFADRIHNAVAGGGTNDDTLIRIIVSRSELDLARIGDCYNEQHGKSLVEAVADDCGGDYKRMLLAILRGGVDEE